ARVAPLPDPGPLSDTAAQVVQLGAPHIPARGDLDPLDLRRVHRKGPLYPNAEGLLAHGERLAYAVALALDHDPLEHLRPAPRALDHLKMHPHPVTGVEDRHAAELSALQAVDQGAHGKLRRRQPRRWPCRGSAPSPAPPAAVMVA